MTEWQTETKLIVMIAKAERWRTDRDVSCR